MTLTLHVDRDAWEANVRDVAARYDDVLAVVKGNGYGFGLGPLAATAVRLGFRRLAVGTVYEIDALPPLPQRPVVLTPALELDSPPDAVLTIGSTEHVAALARRGQGAPVAVKLASSMQRYGVDPDELASLLGAVERAGLGIDQFALHLPLAGDAAEVEAWLPRLPADTPLTVSHVDVGALDRLRASHPGRRIVARLGTALWHGDKSFLDLRADVIDVRTVDAQERAGYRLVDVPGAGTLVMVGTGTAHGVHPLPDGRSPFHFARRRLALLEPPHMHTSMVFVPAGDPVPTVGDEIDVQQPLTYVRVDRVVDR
ncbi:MAG TPA: alanine racemase [Acidimicrobiales bacterium]